MSSNILEQLNWRYATKVFDRDKKLSEAQVGTLTEALRLSASSFGLQPWKFLVIADQQLKDKLLEHSWNQSQVVDASHTIVLCGRTDVDENYVDSFLQDTANTRGQNVADLEGYKKMMMGFFSRMNDSDKAHWVRDQVYLALGNLLTVCAVEGIDACPMEGFVSSKYDEVLNLASKKLTSVVVCPVGHRSNDDKYAANGKVRWPQDTVVEHL